MRNFTSVAGHVTMLASLARSPGVLDAPCADFMLTARNSLGLARLCDCFDPNYYQDCY